MKIEPVEEIQKLGLNNYEARVYLALMERDSLSVSEVAKISKVPRVRTYDILETLVGRGLASLRPGKYMKYSAIDFDTLGNKLIDQIEKRYFEEKNTIEKVTLTLKKQLEPTIQKRNNRENNPLDYIEIIKNSNQMYRKFIDLYNKAQKEFLNFSKPPYSVPSNATIDERTKVECNALGRGVVVKVLYEIPTEKEAIEACYDDIDMSVKYGEQARVIRELPMKMAIFDERIVLLALEDPVSDERSFTTQIVEHTSIAKGLKILFETLWEKADDYHVLRELIK
jgi:HTH-type transcriptional regulator, sugar sensing transcriptional regulator